jgi:hypothetical protein
VIVETDTKIEPVSHVRITDFEVFYRRSWDGVYRPLAATLGDSDLAAEAVVMAAGWDLAEGAFTGGSSVVFGHQMAWTLGRGRP